MPLFTASRTDFSDHRLYEGLISNDPECFRYLYRRMYPMVRRQLARHGAPDEDSRDVFQEGLIALWENARSGRFQLREGVRISTYLTQICKFRWMDRQRKAGRRRETTLDQLPDLRAEHDLTDGWDDREQQELFQQLFVRLGDRCQDLLQRFYFGKESLQTIARAYDIGEPSAKNQKYRCMQRLRGLCQEAQFTLYL